MPISGGIYAEDLSQTFGKQKHVEKSTFQTLEGLNTVQILQGTYTPGQNWSK